MKSILNTHFILQIRFFLMILMAVIFAIIDSKTEAFEKVRTYTNAAISPFYMLINYTYQLLDNVSNTLTAHNKLALENKILHQALFLKNSDQFLLNRYKKENDQLRALLESPIHLNERKMLAQVIATIETPYSNQLIIDKGLNNGVYVGQPVVSDKGVIGQVISANKFTSRTLLICDYSHALPIEVLRNNIRAILFGRGCDKDLRLENQLNESDIHIGDILVTSGLGGRFPEGYPVATVTSVKIDTNRSSIIQAKPIAPLNRSRYLLLIWKKVGLFENGSLSLNEVPSIASEHLM
ncbi:rod shape-determining protein MreC [Sodalis sp. CWE]|uniref:rod shape-determining protein MreC n=1 Tax=Sodalis sp. CWE TaxID=2803816 RepID=UPI001C7D7704|nr:rod shape-determining protein MreC [Sodalis sp. CWE]MBX4180851.1 rod shape-determining protein MreC [Sodalis sp. CWE]